MNQSAPESRSLPASQAHRLLTLIGFSFILFEIIFVFLYSDKFWFSLDIRWLGIPVILLTAAVAHFILRAGQSDRACKLLFPIWKGKPPIAYLRWIAIDADGFIYGIRHINWHAVDELFLTFFGNLEVRSDAFSGAVFKIPFGFGSQESQRVFIEEAKRANPSLRVNQRLESRINSPIVKGQNVVQLLGAAFMALVLLDVSCSLFAWLEMLKHYYLAESTRSRAELVKADEQWNHPLPFSWVTNGYLRSKTTAADLHQLRANANIALNDLSAAAADADAGIALAPDKFRLYLLKARIRSMQGKVASADEAIKEAIEHHQNSLVPRLYLVANNRDKKCAYDEMMKELSQTTFMGEPRWPGTNNAMIESLYSDDVRYIFDPLVQR